MKALRPLAEANLHEVGNVTQAGGHGRRLVLGLGAQHVGNLSAQGRQYLGNPVDAKRRLKGGA